MTWWKRWFRREQLEDQLDAEFLHHLAHQTDAYRQQGLDDAEAHRRARLLFGQLDVVKDDCRQAWGLRPVDTAGLHYAFRRVRRHWGS